MLGWICNNFRRELLCNEPETGCEGRRTKRRGPTSKSWGVREIENVLLVVKTSKLHRNEAEHVTFLSGPVLILSSLFSFLRDVWYFQDRQSVTATGIRGGVRWLGGVEGFPSQRRGTKRLCCCFASSIWWYLIAKWLNFQLTEFAYKYNPCNPSLGCRVEEKIRA